MYVFVLDHGGCEPYIYTKRESAISDAKELFEKRMNDNPVVKEWYISKQPMDENYGYLQARAGCQEIFISVSRIKVCEE